ncbi:hypothetical protein QVD99_007059 [Batrachochytrium dendrobatidis]|nr:hypothetical protein O5D80_007668 [Batrachochytrium dendrobatidis]KAK5666298.1 hypothetical protein QVD99_007059 [Batrachochytrium dendrobatidis]
MTSIRSLQTTHSRASKHIRSIVPSESSHQNTTSDVGQPQSRESSLFGSDNSTRKTLHNDSHATNPSTLADTKTKLDRPSQVALSKPFMLAGSYIWAGLQDSFAWPITLFVVYGSTTLKTRMMQCVFLNGIIFLGSVLIFNNLVSPLAKLCLESLCKSLNISEDTEAIIRHLGSAISGLYYIAWIYPLYAFSFFVNSQWYQDIANRSYEIFVGKPKTQSKSIPTLIKNAASDTYRGLMIFNFFVQVALIYHVPFIGPAFSYILLNFILAFFAFEYKWANRNWSFVHQIEFFESHWAYFFGFGFPMALMVILFPKTVNLGWFALVFPMYIIMANRAKPLPIHKDLVHVWYLPVRMPIFLFAQYASTMIISWIKRRRETLSSTASIVQ